MSNESNPFSQPAAAGRRPLIGRFRLKHTLLATWLLSVVLAVLVLGGLFHLVLNRFNESSAQDNIRRGMSALAHNIAASRASLLRDVEMVAGRDGLATALNVIDSQRLADNSKNASADADAADAADAADKKRIARQINHEIQLLDHRLFSVHDGEFRLLAYARKMPGEDMDAGFAATIGDETAIMALSRDQAGAGAPTPVTMPTLLKEFAAQALNVPVDSTVADFVALSDGRIAIRAVAPVRHARLDGAVRIVGFMQAVDVVEGAFLAMISRRAAVDVAIQVEGFPAIGEQHNVSGFDLRGVPVLSLDGRTPLFASRARDDEVFGFARLPLRGGQTALIALRSQRDTLHSALTSFRAATLPALVLAGLAVMSLGAVFLNRVIFAPLDGLTSAVENLRAGRPIALDPKNSPIEIADLARVFAAMARTIRQREESLRLLNAELERRIEERSAALMESEARYRDYVETASDWVWEMGPDLRFTSFSDRLLDITAVDPAALIGRRRDEIVPPDVDPRAWRRHLDDLAARRPFRDFRYPFHRPDGATIHVAISGKPVFDAQGAFQGYRGVGANVTAVVEAEQRMHESHRLAEMASRAKSEFLANVSHEFRTPLNAILGYSDAMRNRIFGPVANERYRQYVDYIHESGIHLLQLINDVLDVSAIEAGKLALRESDCDVPALVEASVRMVRTRAESKGLVLDIVLPAGLPHLRADERRMKQILINLLSNAVKFTKTPGGVRIETDIAPDGSMRIVVADDGIGMTAEDVEKALQPFGRARSGVAAADEGTGLGLPLARSLAEAHDGTLTVESAPGRGTAVTLLFPPSRVVKNAAAPG